MLVCLLAGTGTGTGTGTAGMHSHSPSPLQQQQQRRRQLCAAVSARNPVLHFVADTLDGLGRELLPVSLGQRLRAAQSMEKNRCRA
jgi:hypothetical protein